MPAFTLPEEITKFIGTDLGECGTCEVDKSGIRRFANAVEDFNPLYWDEEYAKNSKYGSVIAPPGFFGWPTKPWGAHIVRPSSGEVAGKLDAALAKAGYPRGVAGRSEFDFLRPVKVGDILSASEKIIDIAGKEGRTGKMVLVTREITWTDQNGDVVAKVRQTGIRR